MGSYRPFNIVFAFYVTNLRFIRNQFVHLGYFAVERENADMLSIVFMCLMQECTNKNTRCMVAVFGHLR